MYQAGGPGNPQLYLRSLAELDGKPLVGTEHGFNAFFSPDGQWVVFDARGKLKKVSVNGDTPVTLTELPDIMLDGSWAPDGTIIIGLRLGGLMTLPSEGGTRSSQPTCPPKWSRIIRDPSRT